MKPQNLEERLVWYFIVGTYGLYALGCLHLASPALIWLLGFYLFKKIWDQAGGVSDEKPITIPWLTWFWFLSMLFMAVITAIGCLNYGYEPKETLRAVVHWFWSWAILGIAPLIGCFNIRPQIIYRAICILCLQSLFIIPIFYVASQVKVLGGSGVLYTSPLGVFFKAGAEFYNVNFYAIDYESGQPRLYLFAPWAPALGLISNVYFFLALQDPSKKWRFLGISGSIAMCIASVSRLAIVSLPVVFVTVLLLKNISRPAVQITAGLSSFFVGILSTPIVAAVRDARAAFTGARASSSRVRAALARIAFERWKEAPIWGHGISEKGSEVVASKLIGSHHTWMGLLFLKGAVGFMAFLLPMLWSFIDLLLKIYKSDTAKVAFCILLILFLFSFAENLESLAYLYWPGLVIMGMAYKEKIWNFSPVYHNPGRTSA
jgi:hypothetical protein